MNHDAPAAGFKEGGSDRWLSGDALYGDDFSPREVADWYEAEREAYAELGARRREDYDYGYHAINRILGFRHLPKKRYRCAVGIGAAYGDEFSPIASSLDKVVVVDSSGELRADAVGNLVLEYRSAKASGDLPIENGEADLVTCFGVLHHIANVSHVVAEIARCLGSGGYALIREPIISMGDWRAARPGLTARERGLPLRSLLESVKCAGLTVDRASLCFFPVASRLGRALSGRPYDSEVVVHVDRILSRMFSWNLRYHATRPWHKLRPTSVFLVLRK